VARKRRSLLKRMGDRVVLLMIPFFTYGMLRFFRMTMRIEELNAYRIEPLVKDGDEKPSIIVFWHNRLLMMPLFIRERRFTMMISRHRDGELIARAIKFFPIECVRGSTTRGGPQALRGLVRALRNGSHVAITPDGPKGPRNVAQKGAVMLAAGTGRAIVPVTFGAARKKIFNSWDRFLLPYPFSRGVFVWGEPIWVDSREDEAGIEMKRKTLETRLNQITAEADQYFNP
jgi:lysophospholipid acyltransferase (LPLAT)-like uncharacterized protein